MIRNRTLIRHFSSTIHRSSRRDDKLLHFNHFHNKPELLEYHLRWRKEIEKAFGIVPKNIKEFNIFRRRIEKWNREAKEWKDYQELLEVHKYTPEEQRFERNTQVISKIDMGEISFIMTRDLFQYMKVGELIFDVNSRFLEFNRRVYDYCSVRKALNCRFDPELDLYMRLLRFKNKDLLRVDYKKRDAHQRCTFTAHMALDKISGIETHLIQAVEKFMKERPADVEDFLSSFYARVKETRDLCELPDSKAVRTHLKASPFIGKRKVVLDDVVEIMNEEDKGNNTKEVDTHKEEERDTSEVERQ